MSFTSSSNNERERWNQKYLEAAGAETWTVPDPFLARAFSGYILPLFPHPGSALDLAGGAGRHAIWLAKQGWEVTLIDVSDAGVEQARQNAGPLASHMHFVVDDLTHFKASQTQFEAKVGQLPFSPGVYLYKDAGGRVIYVGKAKSLRNRVRSYFSEDKLADIKTGTLIREGWDIDYILVDNEKEALALENNLIKQYKPRFNILLRDDKTFPYIKLTHEKYPRVYVTRRLRKDGATYFGPYFPANLAHRLVHFIHRHFQVPSCKVDLTRFHPKPCLQFHIHRCLGPCVQGLTTDDAYAAAVHDVRLFLEGRHTDLARDMRVRMEAASQAMRFEEAAGLRDLIATVEEIEERQKMAAAKGDDVDIFAVYAEPPLVALNLFHLRNGQIVDRRELFWGDQLEYDEAAFFSSLLKQIYLDQQFIPAEIHVPVEFEDREALEELLSEMRNHKVEIRTPQRGQKKAL